SVPAVLGSCRTMSWSKRERGRAAISRASDGLKTLDVPRRSITTISLPRPFILRKGRVSGCAMHSYMASGKAVTIDPPHRACARSFFSPCRTPGRLGPGGCMRTLVGSAVILVVLAASAAAGQTRAPALPKSAIKVESVAKGLNHPWGLQFLPDGRLIVTERSGSIRIVTRAGQLSQPLAG